MLSKGYTGLARGSLFGDDRAAVIVLGWDFYDESAICKVLSTDTPKTWDVLHGGNGLNYTDSEGVSRFADFEEREYWWVFPQMFSPIPLEENV